MSVREDQGLVAVLGAAVLALLSVAVSVPTFTYLKNRNDSSIALSTLRIAEAAERAHPVPLELRVEAADPESCTGRMDRGLTCLDPEIWAKAEAARAARP